MRPAKIRKLYLPSYQQFQRCIVDLTDAEGRAADRVCLIGRNGTGKSTILRILDAFLETGTLPAGVAVEIERAGRHIFISGDRSVRDTGLDITTSRIDSREVWDCENVAAILALMKTAGAERIDLLVENPGASDLLVYCPADPVRVERRAVDASGHPKTSLNSALELFKTSIQYRHVVSNERVDEMWRVLVYLVKKRESDRQAFETTATNLQKTKAQLIVEFDRMHPSALDALGRLWNRILEPAGLELDVEGAKIPVQLNENLEAYIRLRDSKQVIPYNALSTGIRNFLFRIGHLFLLYFNRAIDRGFVLVDEPENSLFPDFLFELMQVYEEILRDSTGVTRTQLFVATHSPIVAAQFAPEERVVLSWNDDASVTASKGSAPKGDDPNDVLRKDFHLPELMGPEGVKSWREYLELRKQIRRAAESEKPGLVARALDIAERYGFEPVK